MNWWAEVTSAMSAFLDKNGLIAGFVFLLMEEAGVPVPVPGDFVMLLLGVQARNGQVVLWQAMAAMEAATIIGSTFLYTITRIAGRGLVYRYGKFVKLSPARLDSAERWIQKHGSRAIFVGRLIPGLRIVTAVACGIFLVPLRTFLPAMAFGALGYIVVYTLVGYFVGPPVLSLLGSLHLPFSLIGTFLILAVLVVWIVRARGELDARGSRNEAREHVPRLRAGASAGLIATIGATLLLNVLVNLAGSVAFLAPGTIVEQTAAHLATGAAQQLQPLLLFAAVPVYLLVGVLWGAAYAVIREWPSRAPDWIRGLLFASLPLAISLVMVMPLLGMGFLGVSASGPVAAIEEVLRHAAYGLLLGLVLPVFVSRDGPSRNDVSRGTILAAS